MLQPARQETALVAVATQQIPQPRQFLLGHLGHGLSLNSLLLGTEQVEEAQLQGQRQLVEVVDGRSQGRAHQPLELGAAGGGDPQAGALLRSRLLDQPLDRQQREGRPDEVQRGTDDAGGELTQLGGQFGVGPWLQRQRTQRRAAGGTRQVQDDRDQRTGGATLEQVAKVAGVSRATVSRVVNGSPRVSGDVRRAVEAAVVELGYVPNRAARSLVTRRR